jgi:hypothetical protein
MHTTEVYIDIPCDDHLDHTSKIGSMKFRMNEDLVRIYSGKPDHLYCCGHRQSDYSQKYDSVRDGGYHREEEMAATERVI